MQLRLPIENAAPFSDGICGFMVHLRNTFHDIRAPAPRCIHASAFRHTRLCSPLPSRPCALQHSCLCIPLHSPASPAHHSATTTSCTPLHIRSTQAAFILSRCIKRLTVRDRYVIKHYTTTKNRACLNEENMPKRAIDTSYTRINKIKIEFPDRHIENNDNTPYNHV